MSVNLNHPYQRQVFFNVFEHLPRGGPGDTALTARALRLVPNLPASAWILDVGCGPGMQTLDLAHLNQGRILAVDNYLPFVSRLRQTVEELGLSARIQVEVADMVHLDYPEDEFDLIWCEGAIYNLGFENGLAAWQRFLKPGGSLAVSEAVWLQANPPADLEAYWQAEYPAMRNIETCLGIIHRCGYQVLGHFTFPVAAWWDHYYTPLLARLSVLREHYRGDPVAEALLAELAVEPEIHRKYSDYFGYEFFVMQK